MLAYPLDLSADGKQFNHGFELIRLNGAGNPAEITYYQVLSDGSWGQVYHESIS